MSYNKRVIALIIITTVVRIILSATSELNNDEVYYWTYAKHLQWNYFDHPPMVAVWIRFFTAGLEWNHEIFIRLGSVVSSALSTWLMYIIGKKLKDEYTGWLSACLFSASLYSSIIAGVLILPDSPQLFFWLTSVYWMVCFIKKPQDDRAPTLLLLLGISIGLCILSKVHGVFCWIGFIGYCIFHRRSIFKNPFLYISLFVTAVMLVPSLIWSMNNQLSTYDYHSSRILIRQLQPDSFFRELFGSFLYNNPLNVILLILSIVHFRKSQSLGSAEAYRLIFWVGFPLIITVLFLSLFNDTLPHWSGPAYTTLIFISSMYLSNASIKFVRKSLKYALVLTTTFIVVAFGIINFWPGTLGEKKMPDFGKHDITLDMSGWRQFGKDFKKIYESDTISLTKKPVYLFSNYWFPAAHLDFYVARPVGVQVMAFGNLHNIHHFEWLNKYLSPMEDGDMAYYITISNFNDPPSEELKKMFEEVSEPVSIPQIRNGKIARYFYIYRMKSFRTDID